MKLITAHLIIGTYGDSKLANVIFAKELNERFNSQGVLTFSLHPGTIGTNLSRSMVPTAMLDFVFARSDFVLPRYVPLFGMH